LCRPDGAAAKSAELTTGSTDELRADPLAFAVPNPMSVLAARRATAAAGDV
jgi:hypothetical protein